MTVGKALSRVKIGFRVARGGPYCAVLTFRDYPLYKTAPIGCGVLSLRRTVIIANQYVIAKHSFAVESYISVAPLKYE